LVVFCPIGLYYAYNKASDGLLFSALYVVLSVYFASVMVRLLLVLAPAVCIAAGIGASVIVRFFTKSLREILVT
jgi:dolichyl-diphosphooligosaccharide--protein glycosyltransferase